MTENSLYPACVRLLYHSAYGEHTMTIPTREWDPDLGVTGLGGYLAWNDDERDADNDIVTLATHLATQMPTTAHFDGYIIYTLDSPTSPLLPRVSATLDVTGAIATAGQSKAVQRTYSFRTTAFGLSKLSLLDAWSGGVWERTTDISGSAPTVALVAYFTSVEGFWSGRDGARPATFTQIATTLNDSLRRKYGMN